MDPAIPEMPSDPVPPPPGGGTDEGLRILLVEDNADIARVLASLLMRDGHVVAIAASMFDAEQTAAISGPFDLLISDLSLPDGTGLELKRKLAAIPGIAVSGYSTEVDLQECLDAGFLDLLAKPVDLAALKATIERLRPGAE